MSVTVGEGVAEAGCHEGGRWPDTAETGAGELTFLGLLSTGQWIQWLDRGCWTVPSGQASQLQERHVAHCNVPQHSHNYCFTKDSFLLEEMTTM